MPPAAAAIAVATRQPTNFEIELANYEPQIAAALPSHITVDRFKRIVITAINRNPDLAKADRRSLFNACVQCASDGLVPDGREAALVIFRTKDRRTDTWIDVVQYLPMIQGVIKRMRNSGDVAAVDAQVVHERDEFDYQLGDDPRIVHKPALDAPGKMIGAYAIIKLTNGEILREVMSIAQIEKVRSVSRTKDKGPWVEWFDEMARKTVLRRCSKRAPVSPDLEKFLHRESAFEQEAQPELAPPRPTRATLQNPFESESREEPEEWEFTDAEGEVRSYQDPSDWALTFTNCLTAVTLDAARKDGVWETNSPLLARLRELGADGEKLAADVHAANDARLAEEDKRKRAEAEQSRDQAAGTGGKAEGEKAAPASPDGGGKAGKAKAGKAADLPPMYRYAKQVAEGQGTDILGTWWDKQGAEIRASLEPYRVELFAAAQARDEQVAAEEKGGAA